MLSISCFINNQKVNITKHIIKFQLHKNLIIIPSKYMENHITKNLIYVHLNKKNYIADNNYYIFIDLINSKVYTSNQTNNVYVNFNEIISKKKIINQIFELDNTKNYRHLPFKKLSSQSQTNFEVNVLSLVGNPCMSVYVWDEVDPKNLFRLQKLQLKNGRNNIILDPINESKYFTFSLNLDKEDEIILNKFSINQNNLLTH